MEGLGGQAGSLYGLRVGVGPGIWPEGGLRWAGTPLVVLSAGSCKHPAFALGTSGIAAGILDFQV